jgi:hypothetical protein
VGKLLDVASWPGDRRRDAGEALKTQLTRGGKDTLDRLFPDSGVPDHATPGDLLPASLKLGLHQGNQIGAFGEERHQRRKHEP